MTKKRGKPHALRGVQASTKPRPSGPAPVAPSLVIGVGASAGGLEPILALLSPLKPGCGLAIILVRHLDSGGDALLASLSRKNTLLNVMEAVAGTPLLADHVYMMPGRGILSVIDGRLSTQDVSECQGLRMPIDHFLCSLAADQGRRSIGIILSGAGKDGTHGLAEIKAAGGLTLAQDPQTAEFPEMPANAIAAGYADAVLAPGKMAAFLTGRFAEMARLTKEQEERAGLEAVLAAVRNATGHNFHCYKRATLERRTRRRLALHDLNSYDDYARMIRMNKEEAAALRKDLLIGVTEFFRQPEAWRVLAEKVVAGLIQKAPPESTLRVWAPACSIGKEAFSIAMLLVESLERGGAKLALQIFATDADASAVEIARRGLYTEEDLEALSPERLERFCVRKNGRYEMVKELRALIVFAPQDLTADPPFSKLDLIVCRNLLIYLDPAAQRNIIQLFHFALREGGYLFLGSAETICGQENLFEPVSQKWRIYRKLGVATPVGLQLPLRSQSTLAVTVPPAAARPLLTLPAITNLALAERYAPAAAVVDRKGALLYTHGNVRDFLELPIGAHTGLLADSAREGLRNRLAGAILQAATESRKIVVQARVKKDKKTLPVKVTVSPMRQPREADGLLLATFEALGQPKAQPAAAGKPAHSGMRQLEDELKLTREELQSTIERLEQSNEHLKASHEEVTAANEELQSANEELETSKEEIQSVNEELNAVNLRLQDKVVELEQSGNDMSNLLTSGGIATLFLDRELKVRRFTQAVTALLSLVEADIGRPIADIHRKIHDDALPADAGRVLVDLMPAMAEVRADDGHWYVRRILPYRTKEDRIDGVVITFNDVSELKELTDAVRVSEERFSLLVDGVRDYAIIMLDPKGRVVSWNDGARRMKGWTAEEIVGQHFSQFYPPEIVAAGGPRIELERAIAQGSNEDEGWRVRKDGSRFWANVITTALRDANGSLRGFAKITRNITERKQAEQALAKERDSLEIRVKERTAELERVVGALREEMAERERAEAAVLAASAYNRSLLEASLDPLVTIGPDGRITDVNAATEQVTGMPRGQLIGSEFIDYFTEPDRATAGYRQVLAEGQVRDYPLTIRHVSGAAIEVLYNATVYRNETGEVQGVFAAARDITERKKAEAALKEANETLERRVAERTAELAESEERLATVFRIGPTGIFITRLTDGLFLDVNEAYLRLIGYSRAETIGHTSVELNLWVNLEDRNRIVGLIREQGRVDGFEVRFRRKSGEIVDLLVSALPLERGGEACILGTLTDITERKQAEQRLAASLQEKEVLLKEIHHRVKNNMQVISSLVSLQADSLADPVLRGVFQDVRDRVRSMALVHENLYRSANLDRVDFADYTRSLLRHLWLGQKDAAGSIRLALDLQPVTLSVGNAVPCGLVLNELATNALKHAFKDRAEGEVRVALGLEPGGRVCLCVSDNGVGLPTGLDWRESSTLGMKLVQMLTKQLNGTMEVHSGAGTEFRLTFSEKENHGLHG